MMADVAEIPVQANRTLALLTTLMRYAIDNGWRESNPCARIKRFREEERVIQT